MVYGHPFKFVDKNLQTAADILLSFKIEFFTKTQLRGWLDQ